MTAVRKTAKGRKSSRLAGQDTRELSQRGILKKSSRARSAAEESAAATAAMSAALEKRAAHKQKLMADKLVASMFRGEDISPSERRAAKRRLSAGIPEDDKYVESKARKLSPHKSKVTGKSDSQQSPSKNATRSSPPQEPSSRPHRLQPGRKAKKMVRFDDSPVTRIEYPPITPSFNDMAVVVPGVPTATKLIGQQLFDLTCQSIALLLKWEQQFEALKEQNPDLGFKAAPFKKPKDLDSMYDLLYIILGVMKEPQQIHATRKLGKWPPRTERQQIAVLKKLVDESIDRELTNASNQMKSVLGGPNLLRCRAAIKIQATLGKIWGLQNHMEVLMQDMLDEDSWRLEFNAFVSEAGVMPEETRDLLRKLVPVPPAAISPVSPLSPRHWHFREPGTRQYQPRSGRIPRAPRFD
ncbi:hypothetical protein BDV97DRAFT_405204 [Delphinella strobiligena]|nr:hypothetical protein BDV97DRAFT_405204 [Delphinella strobiligena]